MKRLRLRELLSAALSLSNLNSIEGWERRLVKEFNASLGGVDIFKTTDHLERVHILASWIERDSVQVFVYSGGAFYPKLILGDRIEYAVTGNALSVHFLRGDREKVLATIESGYQTALEYFGDYAFRTMFDKELPYSVMQDPALIDVTRGVVECAPMAYGGIKNPLKLEMPAVRRLRVGAYHDLRSYRSHEDLVLGLYSLWRAIVSEYKGDWEEFCKLAQPTFLAMQR